MMKILVVDDERLARERLIDLISELSISTSIKEAEHGVEALENVKRYKPDVIMLDIRMPLMDGLEVAHHLTRLNDPPAIIFTTAYQDHALEAFDNHAIDYLLKPIRKERLVQALDRAKMIARNTVDKIRNEDKANIARSHISANVHGNIQLVPVDKIYYLKADQKYVIAAWPGGELLIDESLKSLESEFNKQFIRVHRNALVAWKFIEALKKDKQQNVLIKLRGVETPLQVSRRHVSDIRNVIQKLTRKNQE